MEEPCELFYATCLLSRWCRPHLNHPWNVYTSLDKTCRSNMDIFCIACYWGMKLLNYARSLMTDASRMHSRLSCARVESHSSQAQLREEWLSTQAQLSRECMWLAPVIRLRASLHCRNIKLDSTTPHDTNFWIFESQRVSISFLRFLFFFLARDDRCCKSLIGLKIVIFFLSACSASVVGGGEFSCTSAVGSRGLGQRTLQPEQDILQDSRCMFCKLFIWMRW